MIFILSYSSVRIALRRVSILGVAMFAFCGTALAQTGGVPDELTRAYAEGLKAYQAGQYAQAIPAFETILAKAGEGAQLETVFYALGAAYFGAEDFPKAISTFKLYLEKYPNAESRMDALQSLGLAAMRVHDYKTAGEAFKQMEGVPAYREEALLNGAMAKKEAGEPDAAIKLLDAQLADGVRSNATASGAMLLAEVYAEKGDGEKAVTVLKTLRKQTKLLDNVVRLNAKAIELGDQFLKNQMPAEALACYQLVQTRDEVIRLQQERIADQRKQIAENLVLLRANPAKANALLARNAALNKAAGETEKNLAAFQKQPDFQPGLWLRLGRSYSENGDKWESVAAYDELLRKYPEASEREPALYGLLVASADANRDPARIRRAGELYLKEFPKGPNASVVGYLMGASALQANESSEAETLFGRMLENQPESTYREEMRFLLGNARFAQAKYDEARKDYESYLKDYPQGSHVEEIVYRIALTSLFTSAYDEAIKGFNDYLARYPEGKFRGDVKYRMLVCDFAASKFDDVISGCAAWEKEYGNDPLLGEVLALEADAMVAKDKTREALDLYLRSLKAGTTNEVLNYSLFAAQKILQGNGDWEQMTSMLDDFVTDHPDNPSAVMAIYWISKAKVREGRIDEARQYVAQAIQKYIDDPTRDAVEQLLSQLAQLCLRAAPGAQPPADPAMELQKLLGASAGTSPLAKARILYAKAVLAGLRKQPQEAEKYLQNIVDEIPLKYLSAPILARVGDYLVMKSDFDKAEKYFNHLLDNFSHGDFVEYAYCGLGQVAYGRGRYEQALQLFADAIDKGAATATLKDVTLGKAKTLLAMDRLEEAKKTFQQVASVREWRGDATAFSVYSLGEIEQRQGKLPEAIAYYQRVYVAYRKYLPWVAKSYVKSAECFEKLGEKNEATNTYRELLRNDNLSSFPEYQTARERLDNLDKG